MLGITGATGQLGQLVLAALKREPGGHSLVAVARDVSRAASIGRGVLVRQGDYSKPDTLVPALAGVSRLLLISGSEIGRREEQHAAVIAAAQQAGVGFIAYTSILHCDTSPLLLAREHQAPEERLRASGLAYSMLRNGWYFENFTAAMPEALRTGSIVGASGEGRFACAARADYAAAAAKVLASEGHENTVYELAGDESYTRAEIATEIGKVSGKRIVYQNLSGEAFEEGLAKHLPSAIAHIIANSETEAANGALDDQTHTLSSLLGRPTASLSEAVRRALAL